MKSSRGPIVVYPPFLRGKGAELNFARKTYYITRMREYLSKYEEKLVASRAKYLAKKS